MTRYRPRAALIALIVIFVSLFVGLMAVIVSEAVHASPLEHPVSP